MGHLGTTDYVPELLDATGRKFFFPNFFSKKFFSEGFKNFFFQKKIFFEQKFFVSFK